MEIKRLSECTFEQAVEAWNKGFEGYSINVTLTMERLLASMVVEGKFPSTSFIALENGEPIGLVLNAIRDINGRKIAWNGGTGVAKSYRGMGLGEKLIKKSIELYEENGVKTAYLESISNNKPAIKLYEKFGYTVIDKLSYMETSSLSETAFSLDSNNLFTTEDCHWSKIVKLPFYNNEVPWQNRFENVQGASSTIVYQGDEAVSYFLKKLAFDSEGKLIAIILYQVEMNENVSNADEAMLFTLNKIFEPVKFNCNRMVVNFSNKKEKILHLLMDSGFNINVEQVHMKKEL